MNATAIASRLLETEEEEGEYEFDKEELLSLMRPVKRVQVFGRRWFRRTVGRTYHTVDVYINNKKMARLGPANGGGDQYEQTAFNWLRANNYVPTTEQSASPWYWYNYNGIEYLRWVIDVKRKRELFPP